MQPYFDPVEWRSWNRNHLPQSLSTAEMIFLVQPSSAASEQVFTILTNSVGDLQQTAWKNMCFTTTIIRLDTCLVMVCDSVVSFLSLWLYCMYAWTFQPGCKVIVVITLAASLEMTSTTGAFNSTRDTMI